MIKLPQTPIALGPVEKSVAAYVLLRQKNLEVPAGILLKAVNRHNGYWQGTLNPKLLAEYCKWAKTAAWYPLLPQGNLPTYELHSITRVPYNLLIYGVSYIHNKYIS